MYVGTIVEVNDFPRLENRLTNSPSILRNYWNQKTSAQITKRYSKADLLHRQIVAVINFPKKANWQVHERMPVLALSEKKEM
jgi:tRNA-binding protein